MKLRHGLVYDRQRDVVEDFDNLDSHGRTIRLADHTFSVIRAKGGIRYHHISFSQLIDKQLLIQF